MANHKPWVTMSGRPGRRVGHGEPFQPTAALNDINQATEHLLKTAATFHDADVRAPSLLPGWSRGHVLTHLARNADSTRNLLIWARTGIETPDYPNLQARAADIEAGATRTAIELLADLRRSAARLAADFAQMPPSAWEHPVRWTIGGPGPVRWSLRGRLQEVLIHHVDLAAGYTPADWPSPFVAATLANVVRGFSNRTDAPVMRLHAEDTDHWYDVGDTRPTDTPEIRGTQRALLAWLIGRSRGADLSTTHHQPLPLVPPLH